MNECIFRITQSQINQVNEQFSSADTNTDAYILVECGKAYAKISSVCERTIWCAHKILSLNERKDYSHSNNYKMDFCIFTTSYNALITLQHSGITPQLWATEIDRKLHVFLPNMEPISVNCVIGADLYFMFKNIDPLSEKQQEDQFFERTSQAFGKGTTNFLANLTVAVIGASGTGSIVAEQMVRLGVKRIILVDDDIVETRNLGRILNSTKTDAKEALYKTDMLKTAYEKMGLGAEVVSIPTIVAEADTIHAISVCDVIFGCLDSSDGRHHLNRISTFYNIPYIDMGVKLVSKEGRIEEISGSVRYIIPGESSLLSRKVYTLERLSSDTLRRKNPEEYRARLNEKYIEGASESSPAVISINMQIASLAVLELLARIHPFRGTHNDEIETVLVDLVEPHFIFESPSERDNSLIKYVGRGDCSPLLMLPDLGV
ncbi:MAG: ThiF family adenylyltransferase [Anaerotignum sp.]|nr:ThiF family adenylyltransferase [Anaerotignum sp.]